MQHTNQPIIFYDGLCGLCDKSVQFVLANDKAKRFLFCALQSNLAVEYLGNKHTSQSIVLYYKGNVYYKSTAALRIAWLLGGFWSMLAMFLIVPPFIRNLVYDWIARNRYRWFGKYDACKIPTAEIRDRFIGV